ncbi:MAG: Hpt domain-containing protein [Bacteroidetes bacterium]|nr:Hpt domain-containing protein [Bacteroidota bacterium]
MSQSAPPLYDFAFLNEVGRGDPAFLERMIRLFLSDIPPILAELNRAYEQDDPAIVKSLAHRLKSTAEAMGIVAIQQDLVVIEKMAADQLKGRKLNASISRLNQVMESVCSQLTARLAL